MIRKNKWEEKKMALFGLGKKKEKEKEAVTPCDCGGACGATEVGADAKFLILGGGCNACNQLEAATVEALKELGIDEPVGHITDFAVIATYGVMSTPALVVDGKVVLMGKVAKCAEIVELIKKARM